MHFCIHAVLTLFTLTAAPVLISAYPTQGTPALSTAVRDGGRVSTRGLVHLQQPLEARGPQKPLSQMTPPELANLLVGLQTGLSLQIQKVNALKKEADEAVRTHDYNTWNALRGQLAAAEDKKMRAEVAIADVQARVRGPDHHELRSVIANACWCLGSTAEAEIVVLIKRLDVGGEALRRS